MDINSIASLVSIVGVALAYFSFMKDKLKSAEEFGKLQQKLISLRIKLGKMKTGFRRLKISWMKSNNLSLD